MDDIDRLRRLIEEAPPPDAARKAEARRELMELAEEEARGDEEVPTVTPAPPTRPPGSRVGRFRRALDDNRTKALAAAAAFVVLAGVGGLLFGLLQGADTPAEMAQPEQADEQGPTVEQEPGIALEASCTGPEDRYEVRYPDDWHTDDPTACRFFDEEPLGEAIGGPALGAVTVRLEPVAFDDVVGPDETVRVLSSEEATIDGHPAVRQVQESTGAGVGPEGVLSYTYFVELGDETLIASTQDADGVDFDERRRLLDEMVASLRIDG